MNSHRISRNRRIKIGLLVTAIILFLLWLTPTLLGRVGELALRPVITTQAWLVASADSLPYFWRDRSSLLDEINTLRQQIPTEGGARRTVAQLQQENAELRQLVNADDHARLAAGVVGRPETLPYDSLLLDQGSVDGVVEGAPVFSAGDTVIGVVSRVYAQSAVVTLVTTPGFKSTVYVYGPDIYTTAEGQGGGVLRVGVPQGIVIEEGNLVVLPTLESGIFGEINTVVSLPTQPEQHGFVSLPTATSELRLVTVGDRALTPPSFTEAQEHVATIEGDYFVVPVPADILIEVASSTATSTEE